MIRIPLFRRLFRHQQGVALMEMAFVMPFLLLLMYGAIEVVRFISISQRVDKAAFTIANIVTQYPPATPLRQSGEIDLPELNNNVFPQVVRMMDPYRETADMVAIIASVRRESDVSMLKWQVAGGGTLSAQVTSVIGDRPLAQISPASWNSPANFSDEAGTLLNGPNGMLPNENMIVVEMFYRYRPMLFDILQNLPDWQLTIGEATLVRRIYMRPRTGDLSELPLT